MGYRIDLVQTRSTPHVYLFVVVLALSGLCCNSYTTGLKKTEANAGETSAISALRTVALAQQGHAVTNEGNYGTFSQLVEGGYLDGRFNGETPEIQGYVFTLEVGEKSFSCNADPAGEQKGRHFYVDSTSPLIRVNANQPASAKDSILKL